MFLSLIMSGKHTRQCSKQVHTLSGEREKETERERERDRDRDRERERERERINEPLLRTCMYPNVLLYTFVLCHVPVSVSHINL